MPSSWAVSCNGSISAAAGTFQGFPPLTTLNGSTTVFGQNGGPYYVVFNNNLAFTDVPRFFPRGQIGTNVSVVNTSGANSTTTTSQLSLFLCPSSHRPSWNHQGSGAMFNSARAPGNTYFASLGSTLEFAGQQTGGPPNGVFAYVGDKGRSHGIAEITAAGVVTDDRRMTVEKRGDPEGIVAWRFISHLDQVDTEGAEREFVPFDANQPYLFTATWNGAFNVQPATEE